MRTLLAFLDGLADAIPGILVMTSSTLLTPHFPGWAGHSVSGLDPALDQRLGGGALLVVAESVGLPVIGAVFLEWVRSDAREAEAFDAAEDAAAAATLSPNTETAEGSDPAAAGADAGGTAGLWWTSDPRFARHRPPS